MFLIRNIDFHWFSFLQAKLLEQMDEEFSVSNIIREEKEKQKQKVFANAFPLDDRFFIIAL